MSLAMRIYAALVETVCAAPGHWAMKSMRKRGGSLGVGRLGVSTGIGVTLLCLVCGTLWVKLRL